MLLKVAYVISSSVANQHLSLGAFTLLTFNLGLIFETILFFSAYSISVLWPVSPSQQSAGLSSILTAVKNGFFRESSSQVNPMHVKSILPIFCLIFANIPSKPDEIYLIDFVRHGDKQKLLLFIYSG